MYSSRNMSKTMQLKIFLNLPPRSVDFLWDILYKRFLLYDNVKVYKQSVCQHYIKQDIVMHCFFECKYPCTSCPGYAVWL